MDYKAILNLMKEMNQTDLTKLEIEEEGIRICMEKGSTVPVTTVQPSIPQMMSAPTPIAAPAAVQPMSAPEPEAEAKTEEISGKKMLSPMVGTFYAQSAPDKPAFVKVGDKVKKGQTLCIIEAMKLMNEIESEYDGEVVDILVENEDMVEFGQPLFIIR
ncbi:acetyl-CoA carboxylase biotin carboxyl carrier protein [Mobilitalea sibirica]|uniref:Biotin carboxyl carrier protein of acetyl-CoA carboxylase n=1 Tax=Mobilitalea sibirica TaxID=1462919 RepID=A0A8J7H890_9FIRM|nr:acetyl-CoA carboxylase biotin carboxyl carrier protein [Mobilitalea sibirica]